MKDIVIVSNYIHFKNEEGNSRFLYLADKLQDEQVEIITSTFYHRKKKQRNVNEIKEEKYKIKLIYEPGYKKNISLKRIYSNIIIAHNIMKYLKKRKKPDLIYCAVPPTTISKKLAKFAKKNDIRFIIDIQDLWPEAYKMIFKVPIISDILFWPIKRQANYTYKNASNIVAVSETYIKRAEKINRKSLKNMSVFLGTDLQEFDKHTIKKTNNKLIQIAYIGTLGHNYNIRCVIDALAILQNQNIKFMVIGDGELRNQFEKYAKEKQINHEFTGRLPYHEMVQKLSQCDIAVNPIQNGAAGSIINKVGDYAAAGLPVINTQECKEYRQLIEEYQCGYNCENEDISEIAKKIEELAKNTELRKQMGQNNRRLAEEKFDRNKTYKEIVKLIKED